MKARFLRTLYFDIEVKSANEDVFPSVEVAADPVVSISNFDSLTNKFYTFAFRKDAKIPEHMHIEFDHIQTTKNYIRKVKRYKFLITGEEVERIDRIYTDERTMLKDWIHFFSDMDPDIACGWSSNDFDFPYLMNRLRHPHINLRNYTNFLSDMIKTYCLDLNADWGNKKKEGEKSTRHQKKFGEKRRRYKPMIGGRVCFDLLAAYRNIKGKHEEGNSLNAVAKRELGVEVGKLSASIHNEDWYYTDLNKFIEYNIRDVELTVLIDRKVGLIKFHDFVQSFNGCLWEKLYEKSVIVDSFVIMHSHEIVLPTKISHERQSFQGAIVLDPVPGIYGTKQKIMWIHDFTKPLPPVGEKSTTKIKVRKRTYMVYFDLAKMYPNNIRSANMSPETYVQPSVKTDYKKMIVLGNGHRFWKPERVAEGITFDAKTMIKMGGKAFWSGTVGFVSKRLTEMFEIRYAIEDEMEQYDYGSYEYENLLGMRQNIKDTINSVWGWIAYPGSRVYMIPIPDSITWMGREEILWSKLMAANLGLLTKYGDTDSIILEIPADSIEECIEICKIVQGYIERSYSTLAAKWGIEDHFFGIEFEKILSFMLFTKAKKRYVGMLVWADGRKVYRNMPDGSKKEGQLFYRGLELRRSDSSWITKKIQRRLFTMLGDGASNKIVFNYLYRIVKKFLDGEYTPLQIGIPKGFARNIDEYVVNSPWIRGAVYSNEYLRSNFGKGSKPKLLYIKRVRGNKYPQTDVVCIDIDMGDLPTDFEIDYDRMLEKAVQMKTNFILDALNLNWNELTTGIRSESLDIWIE